MSILPNMSKILSYLFSSIVQFYAWVLVKTPVRFPQKLQYWVLLEKWKSEVDKGKSFSALLADLSTAFDNFSHKLLPVKFYAYGFGIAALRLIHSYLTNRQQTTKVLLSYSLLDGILFGVPQVYHKDPIPGPLLFNIFLCDLFFIMSETDFARCSADNTSHRTLNTINEVIQSPEHYSNNGSLITKWKPI